MSDKIHGLSKLVDEALAEAEKLVTAGEHSLLPAFQNLRNIKNSLNQRRLQIETYEAEKSAEAKSPPPAAPAKKAPEKLKAKQTHTASDSLGTLH